MCEQTALFILDADVFAAEGETRVLQGIRSNAIALDDPGARHTERLLLPYAQAPQRQTRSADVYVGRLWCKDERGRSVLLVIADATHSEYRRLKSERGARELAREAQLRLEAACGLGLASVDVVRRRSTAGWRPSSDDSAPADFPWLRLVFASPRARAAATSHLDAAQRETGLFLCEAIAAETRKPLVLELLQRCGGVAPGGWCEVPSAALRPPRSRYAVALLAQLRAHDVRATDRLGLPPIRVVSLDIEAHSVDGAFPDAKRLGDACVCVGLAAETFFAPDPDARALALLADPLTDRAPADLPEEGGVYRIFADEASLLSGLGAHLRRLDADVIVGYNETGFDWRYLEARRATLVAAGRMSPQQEQDFARLSRSVALVCPFVDASVPAQGAGELVVRRPALPGLLELDCFLWLKRSASHGAALRDFRLDTAAEHFLGERKADLPPAQIFASVASGHLRRVADYCLQDVRLALALVARLEMLQATLLLARVTGAPGGDVLFRGQQLLVYAQFLREASAEGYVVQEGADEAVAISYEGAQVLEPRSGFYADPVIILDFASLYPSMIIEYNLCPSTLWRAGSLPADGLCRRPPGTAHDFVRGSVRRGLLPRVVARLLEQRGAARAEAVRCGDAAQRSLLHNLQMALKICANSVYGATGSSRGLMSAREVAESTTAAGRHAIAFAREHIETYWPGAEVIYGDTDSCFTRLPEQLRELSLPELFDLGGRIASSVTSAFRALGGEGAAVKLEMERVVRPLLLSEQKKRYAAFGWDAPGAEGRIFAKGIELVRRDSLPMTREYQRRVLEALLLERDVEGAVRLVEAALEEVLAAGPGDDLSRLAQSKSLRAEYVAAETQPQAVVNELRRLRSPGSESRVGGRVDYVVIAGAARRVVDRVEDPEYAAREKLPPDWPHYVEAVSAPLLRLLRVPLRSTQERLAARLDASVERARAAAAARAAREGVVREGARWLPGRRCVDGSRQLPLDFKRARVE
jgi:DNA polymerase delta subunit 1